MQTRRTASSSPHSRNYNLLHKRSTFKKLHKRATIFSRPEQNVSTSFHEISAKRPPDVTSCVIHLLWNDCAVMHTRAMSLQRSHLLGQKLLRTHIGSRNT
eukprot:3219230-Pleurochrysis_carterae.AAC.1